jgi:hypothetical protein
MYSYFDVLGFLRNCTRLFILNCTRVFTKLYSFVGVLGFVHNCTHILYVIVFEFSLSSTFLKNVYTI